MSNVDSIKSFLQNTSISESSVYFIDLKEVDRLYGLWKEQFKGIQPCYAVKCNSDKRLLSRLAELGASFDCASIGEIDAVLSLGISASRIIFANPCKRKKDIILAHQKGVRITTFDTECEIYKIWKTCPSMKCILRIYARDPDARCQLSNKFGCLKEEWINILNIAREFSISLIGISFHVGSGAKSSSAYHNAIREARFCYDLARCYGFMIQIIDIGGGFTSHSLGDIPSVVQKALDKWFPKELGFILVAEPGRFFAETTGYLATNVIGLRKSENLREYWITDSIYGLFNCIMYDSYTPPIMTELLRFHSEEKYKTILYGPTCDGLDKIIEIDDFPVQTLGDWIVFKNMGAYTLEGASNFNGIPFVNVHTVYLD